MNDTSNVLIMQWQIKVVTLIIYTHTHKHHYGNTRTLAMKQR